MISMDITFPIASEDELVIKLERTLQEHSNIKLTIIGKWIFLLTQQKK